jgi:predicted DCC family thiol-disulfide oxidoreductase YuxK
LNRIYIDSNCNFCVGYGHFLKNKNSNLVVANQLDLKTEDITNDELVYERNNEKYYANEAIVESIYDLGSFFKVVKIFKAFPASFTYILYKKFANNRYRFN